MPKPYTSNNAPLSDKRHTTASIRKNLIFFLGICYI